MAEDTVIVQRKPLPRPSFRLPLIGDVWRLDPTRPVQDEMSLARKLGPIFELDIVGNRLIVVAGADIAREVFDEKRFAKAMVNPLTKMRGIAGDGLFTAFNSEPNWAKAHNILAPAFGKASMLTYHDTMRESVAALLAYWCRAVHEGRATVSVPSDMNKLTLDIIGRTGFGYDFESFEADRDPFVESMSRALAFVSSSSNDIPLVRQVFGYKAIRQYPRDVALMRRVVDDVVAARRSENSGHAHSDLLQRMLDSPDPDTGELLDDENIRNQVLTFLVAGHETTAGVLSFALHYLSRDPEIVRRMRDEIAQVWPDPSVPIVYDQVSKFRYVRRVVDETLRLWPSGPAFFRKAREDTVLADTYEVRRGHPILVVLLGLHRDPDVWGPDADTFDPDRFLPDAIRSRPGHSDAYKPFGTGARSCIGRQFALHEAVLALVMMVDRFDFTADPDYQLKVKEMLTIRPEGLRLTLERRMDRVSTS